MDDRPIGHSIAHEIVGGPLVSNHPKCAPCRAGMGASNPGGHPAQGTCGLDGATPNSCAIHAVFVAHGREDPQNAGVRDGGTVDPRDGKRGG